MSNLPQEMYYIIAALAAVGALVFKAGSTLSDIHKDLQELTKDVQALSSLPARVAALEAESLRNARNAPSPRIRRR